MAAQLDILSTEPALDLNEVVFHPHSFADNAGRLFLWNGELYRGISSSHAAFFARLFDEGIIERLAGTGLLIETEQTGILLDGYPMVVRHRPVSFVSYPNEWCAAMLKDAALTIINLALELAERKLTLKDAHPWNVLFDVNKPVYVDLASISPMTVEPGWNAYDEFCRFCYYPLILMSQGHDRIARSLLPEFHGILRRELVTILRGSAPSRFTVSKLLDRITKPIRSFVERDPLTFLKRLRRDVERLRLPGGQHQSLRGETDAATTRRIVDRLLSELRPADVVDLSRGATWTSTMPASRGLNVVSINPDTARAAVLYSIASERDLPILPLLIDFIKPTPSVGYGSHYSIAAVDRLKCEFVLALGLVNEVASKNHLSSDLIVEGLASFSSRWVVADFVPGRLKLSDFLRALHRRFSSVTFLSSGGDETALLLCER